MKIIAITGGNFINKGAESMLMSTVDGIREHFPGYEPVLLDLFPSLTPHQKEQYPFRIFNLHVRSLFRISFPFLKLFFKPKAISDSEKEIKAIFAKADALFDISGYGLSSHNQPLIWSTAYLLPIWIAKKHRIPVYLLPQSIGPFQFSGIKKILFHLWGKSLLNYPSVIFAREPSGLRDLKQVRKKTTLLSPDIVLQSNLGIAPESSNNQFEEAPTLIIPNKQLFNLASRETITGLFINIIEQMLSEGRHVRVVLHSKDDLEFCETLAQKLKHPNLTIDLKDHSLAELIELIGQAEIVVTGRYHGAIHALKHQKPTLILGWADKYKHLASLFGIDPYLIDLRQPLDLKHIQEIVSLMIQNREELSNQLKTMFTRINQTPFWQYIEIES